MLLLICEYQCSVSLPRGAVGWFVCSDCIISWSYSLVSQPEQRLERA